MRRRERPSVLRRRAPTRTPRVRILILCEGEVTEPQYLRAFKHHFRNPLIEVEIVQKCGVTKAAVERAVVRKKQAIKDARKRGDSNLKYDEVWCVLDVDGHALLAEAKALAKTNGIEVAISNPCFELWALLHFQDQTAEVPAKQLSSLLKQHVPAYEKELPFALLIGTYDEAVRRARALEKRQTADGKAGANPSTDVHHLTERIRSAAK